MAKKKKGKSYSRHLVFHTRTGFYSLFIVAVLLLVATIKSYSPEPNVQAVLGKDDDNSGKSEKQEETKAEKEEKREEKKEEIKREFRIETEGLKVKFKSENGKVERKIESDDKIDIDEDDEEELEDRIEEEFEDEHETEIASDSSGLIIRKNKIKVRTGFPLTIDASTNELIVTRPDGTTKVFTVLPDQAVANFMRHKKVNLINLPDDNPSGSDSAKPSNDSDSSSISAGVGDGSNDNSTDSSELNEEETHVTLKERNGLLVYEIKGKKKLRVLGIIPVNVNTTGFVSAESGEVVDQEESIFTKLLNLISI